MHWYTKAQSQDTSDMTRESIEAMDVVSNTIQASMEAGWEDAADYRGEHYTRETGIISGSVLGNITLSGRVMIEPVEGDTSDSLIKYLLEKDPPRSVVESIESEISPLSFHDIDIDLKATIQKMSPVDINLFDVVVEVSVDGSFRFSPDDYIDPDEG